MYQRDRENSASDACSAPGRPASSSARKPGGPAETDSFWRAVVEGLPGAVLILNRDHVCTYASPEALDLFQVRPQSLVGRRPDWLLDTDQLPRLWRTRVEALAGGRAVERVRARRGDGAERWLETVHRTIGDPRDRAAELTVVLVRDVTVEASLQLELTRSEQRYRSLLDSVEEAVLQLDGRWRVQAFNDQALTLLGCRPETLLGRSVFEALMICDDSGRPMAGPLRGQLTTLAQNGQLDLWRGVVRPDGSRVLLRVRTVALDDPRRGLGGTLMVLRDALDPRLDGVRPMIGLREARAMAGFTARECDVLDGMADGGDVPTIAARLGISVHSVRGHVKSITAKLGVHSQLQAVIVAARRGLIDLHHPRLPGCDHSPGDP